MNSYKLLTPGPLTTTDTVKQVMLFDHCTWDDDYKQITQTIRRTLLALGHVSEDDYTAVLMQGSGTFGVESLCSPASSDGRTRSSLFQRGLRPADGGDLPHAGIAYALYEQDNHKRPQADVVAKCLAEDPAITHVAMVHSETTSGILNDIQAVGRVVKAAGKTFLVDAMSSFGGVDIPVSDWGIDFWCPAPTSASRGARLSFILANRDKGQCWPARPAPCPWTCWTSGRGWRRTASGASPPPPMWCWPSPRHWTSWAEGASPPGTAAMPENNRLLIEKMRKEQIA